MTFIASNESTMALPCTTCMTGSQRTHMGGSCSDGNTRMIPCLVALQVTGFAWIEWPLARTCKGPEYLSTLLMNDFIEDCLVLDTVPPDS